MNSAIWTVPRSRCAPDSSLPRAARPRACSWRRSHGEAGWLGRLVSVQALACAAVVLRRVDEAAHAHVL